MMKKKIEEEIEIYHRRGGVASFHLNRLLVMQDNRSKAREALDRLICFCFLLSFLMKASSEIGNKS